MDSRLKYLLVGAATFLIARRIFAPTFDRVEHALEEIVDTDIPYVGLDDADIVKLPHPEIFQYEPMADRTYAITRLGGRVVDPTKYPYSVKGFEAYLADSGVNTTWASARELTTPNHRDIAARFGYTVFLPPHVWWPKGAALALMQNRMREHLGKPIPINNWWRPKEYNAVVGGAPRGDHPDGDALDLSFNTQADSSRALEIPKSLYYTEPILALTIGTYTSPSLHIGIQSKNGRRTYQNA